MECWQLQDYLILRFWLFPSATWKYFSCFSFWTNYMCTIWQYGIMVCNLILCLIFDSFSRNECPLIRSAMQPPSFHKMLRIEMTEIRNVPIEPVCVTCSNIKSAYSSGLVVFLAVYIGLFDHHSILLRILSPISYIQTKWGRARTIKVVRLIYLHYLLFTW